MAILCNIST